MYRSLRHPVETFRTAPVMISCAATNVLLGSISTDIALESSSVITDGVGWGVTAFVAYSALDFVVSAKAKINLRNRLEAALTLGGFNDRVMKTTTEEYCTRQAARVACENVDMNYLDRYTALCAENAENAYYTWLPHI